MDGLEVVEWAVVGGVAVVLPLALGGRWWGWAAVALSTAGALHVERGAVGALLAGPWLLAAGERSVAAARRAGPLLFWTRADVVRSGAAVYAVVAAQAFLQSRSGVHLFGIREPLVLLTAVHFVYAGVGALVLAHAASTTPGPGSHPGAGRLGVVALAATAGAPPVVATGFVARWPVLLVAGAVLMTVGVWVTAALLLRSAVVGPGPAARRALLAVSGLSVWAPMVLAVLWAAGQHWEVPHLPVEPMARWHGLPNALGFVVAGLLARPEPWSTPRR